MMAPSAAEVRALREAGVHPTPVHRARGIEGHPFNGATVVFTGTLNMPRAEAAKRVEACGGTVTETVSKKRPSSWLGPTLGRSWQKLSRFTCVF